ncbi:MAG: fatty acid desaturase [Deltaproteobacteria bacterium]|nr:MAG: fatty acid desaturase [Deltaproteobacteria bacterium]
MLRYRTDRRTLLYLAFTTALTLVNWKTGKVHPVLYPATLFMFFTTAVISHNHNHLGMWRSKALNLLTSYWIAIFYGHPAIAWVPTHNQVHHKLNNRPGDSSRSPKWFEGNHLAALLVYPMLTNLAQTKDINAFLKDLWRRDRAAFFSAASEYAVFFGGMAGLLILDWRKALLFFFIPQQFALFSIQVVNYLQHIETDAYSDWNHSRNFVSKTLNLLLFNNGYHTVHHLKPGLHWSELPRFHAQHAGKIHPSLLQESWMRYVGHTYFIRPFSRAPAPALPAGNAS